MATTLFMYLQCRCPASVDSTPCAYSLPSQLLHTFPHLAPRVTCRHTAGKLHQRIQTPVLPPPPLTPPLSTPIACASATPCLVPSLQHFSTLPLLCLERQFLPAVIRSRFHPPTYFPTLPPHLDPHCNALSRHLPCPLPHFSHTSPSFPHFPKLPHTLFLSAMRRLATSLSASVMSSQLVMRLTVPSSVTAEKAQREGGMGGGVGGWGCREVRWMGTGRGGGLGDWVLLLLSPRPDW